MAYRDYFTDVDGTALADHTPDTENFTWTDPGNSSPITIVNDRLVNEAGTDADYWASFVPGDGEESVELEIDVSDTITADHEWYIYFRYDGSGGPFGNSYSVNLFAFGDGTVGLSIFRRGGEEAFVDLDPFTVGLHRLKAVFDTDTFTITLDGEEILTWTDPSPMAAGPIGISQYQDTGATAFITAFGVPDLPSASNDPPTTNLLLDRLLLAQIGELPGGV